jgi:hypothetical protein
LQEIRKAIRDKYSEVSISAEGKFTYPTGRDGAKVLGYDTASKQLEKIAPMLQIGMTKQNQEF